MLVETLMPKAQERLVTIEDGARLVEAASLLRPGTDLLIACDPAGRMTGVVTRTDIVNQISFCDKANCVADVPLAVTRKVVSCRPEDKLQDVWSNITESGFKNVPVTCRDNRPLGVVTAQDIFRILLEESAYDEAMLRNYVTGVGYR